jgi:hypothetical protein
MSRHGIPSARLAAPAAIAGVLAIALSGCFNPFDPRVAPERGVSKSAPAPTTPEGVLRLFEWCWNNRSIDEYTEIFTDDFRFQYAATDSAGNANRNPVSTRFDEIETARHLFVGGNPTEPPANKIELTLDQNLIAQIDSRPGKQDSTYHREIVSQVVLAIDTDAGNYRVTGQARFFVIRGDSAVIPADMVQKGFRPDSKRWYIERWEDETVGSSTGASAARPAGTGLAAVPIRVGPGADLGILPRPLYVTWGYIKSLYAPLR